jgi:phospholipase C
LRAVVPARFHRRKENATWGKMQSHGQSELFACLLERFVHHNVHLRKPLTKARCAEVLVGIFALTACHSATLSPATPPLTVAQRTVAARPAAALDGLSGKFKHVVIVVQENRTPDNLFNGLPGADTVRVGLNSKGQQVPFNEIGLTSPYDVEHSHPSFVIEYNNAKMNGFDLAHSKCTGKCPPADTRVYAFVKPSETRPYFVMAQQYAFADRMFQSNEGPSFPAHLYVISGTSAPDHSSTLRVSENPHRPKHGTTAGCDSPPGTLVKLIDQYGFENHSMFPCLDSLTIFDRLYEKQLSWRYYQAHKGAGLWNAVDAIRHIRYGGHYAENVVYPPTRFLSDVSSGNLAAVSVITPTAKDSDHAGLTGKTGPSWVAQIVNAVGTSQYWQDTAIFVTWDDWGGWYDHVVPPHYDSYTLGFRVPLIVISRFTAAGYVSHNPHEFGSILKFIEETFGLDSLNTTDVRADDLVDCFNFKAPPRKFKKIPAPQPALEFLHEHSSQQDPDDE